MIHRALASGCALALLAACSGLSEQRPIGNSFAPPDGWHELPMPFKVAINPVLGMWTKGEMKDAKDASDESFVMLMRLPATNNDKSLADSINASSGSKNAEIISKKLVTLCNDTPGSEIVMKTEPKPDDKVKTPVILQVVVGKGKAETLVAIYSHAEPVAADPAAVSAIEKLCPASALPSPT